MITLRTAIQYFLYLGTMEKAPVSENKLTPQWSVFMVYIWKGSSHDDKVGTLGRLVFGVVVLEPSCTDRNFFPRVATCTSTLKVNLHPIIHLGTV